LLGPADLLRQLQQHRLELRERQLPLTLLASSCLVVVPFRDFIDPACEEGLRSLEARGYTVRRRTEPASVDLKRSHLATEGLADGFEEILWIDPDTVFHPDAVERLRSHGLPLVAGLYPKRVRAEFACVFLPDTPTLTLGVGGGVVEVRYVGTGFLLTRRSVYEDIARKFALPSCNKAWPTPVVPYFLPLTIEDDDLSWRYLSHDYSFCERARQAGHKVMLDTSIRLWHVGTYTYGWEDVLSPMARVPTATMKLAKIE
jgi:hypothetical protein